MPWWSTAADIFNFGGKSKPIPVVAPQGRSEPNVLWAPRVIGEYPWRSAGRVTQDLTQGVGALVENIFATPQSRSPQPAPAGGGGFPNSYLDPRWDELEAQIAGPEAGLLKLIRTQGERSNSDQVNPRTGATTPYQITADTRQSIIAKYKFDPWSSPENAVKGAAIVLRDHGGAANPVAAVGGYFGGAAGARNPFSTTIGDGNLTMNEYVSRVLGQNLVNPFDPRMMGAAQQSLAASAQAANTPYYATQQGEPMPAMPEPTPVPKTDFAAADAALQALRPVEMTIKEERDIHWKNFWGGLGQAMMSSPEGEGLGSFFLRLGGAALAAKGQTGGEILAKREAYEAKLAKWQAALYEHNFQKAQMHQQELLLDWQANQQYVQKNYAVALANWEKGVTPQVSSDGSRISWIKTNPKTGATSIAIVPVTPVIAAEYGMRQANLFMQGFQVQNQANADVAGVANRVQGQLVMAQAAQTLASNAPDAEKAAAAAMGRMPAINYAVDTGQVASVVGPDEYERMTEEVMTTLTGLGFTPGTKEYTAAAKEAMVGRLLGATSDPATLQRLMDTMGPAANLYDTYDMYRRRTQRRTVKRGNVTEVEEFEAP